MVTNNEIKEIMQSLLFTRSREHLHTFYQDLTITEGVRRILEVLDIHWFIDLIYIEKQSGLGIYQIIKKGNSLEFICKDATDKVLKRIMINRDFPLKEFTLMYQENNVFLPMEY